MFTFSAFSWLHTLFVPFAFFERVGNEVDRVDDAIEVGF